MLDTEGPRMVRTQEKPGDMPFAGYNWRTLESVCSTTGLRDTRLTSHPHRDEQPRSCCLPPCCGLDKKRAELPSALLQWLPRVSRTSREPAQRKVAARDNACVGGS